MCVIDELLLNLDIRIRYEALNRWHSVDYTRRIENIL